MVSEAMKEEKRGGRKESEWKCGSKKKVLKRRLILEISLTFSFLTDNPVAASGRKSAEREPFKELRRL